MPQKILHFTVDDIRALLSAKYDVDISSITPYDPDFNYTNSCFLFVADCGEVE